MIFMERGNFLPEELNNDLWLSRSLAGWVTERLNNPASKAVVVSSPPTAAAAEGTHVRARTRLIDDAELVREMHNLRATANWKMTSWEATAKVVDRARGA